MNDLLNDILDEMVLIEEYFYEVYGVSLSESEEMLQEGDRLNRIFGTGLAGIRFVKNKSTGKIEARRTGITGFFKRGELTQADIDARIGKDAEKRLGIRDNDDSASAKALTQNMKTMLAKRLDSKKKASEEKIDADEKKETANKKKTKAQNEYNSAKSKREKHESTINDLLNRRAAIDRLSSGHRQNKLIRRYDRAAKRAKKDGIVTDSDINAISTRLGREDFRQNVLPGKLKPYELDIAAKSAAKDTAKREYDSAAEKSSEKDKKLKGFKLGYVNNKIEKQK